jgi:hypothetical protein
MPQRQACGSAKTEHLGRSAILPLRLDTALRAEKVTAGHTTYSARE